LDSGQAKTGKEDAVPSAQPAMKTHKT